MNSVTWAGSTLNTRGPALHRHTHTRQQQGHKSSPPRPQAPRGYGLGGEVFYPRRDIHSQHQAGHISSQTIRIPRRGYGLGQHQIYVSRNLRLYWTVVTIVGGSGVNSTTICLCYWTEGTVSFYRSCVLSADIYIYIYIYIYIIIIIIIDW